MRWFIHAIGWQTHDENRWWCFDRKGWRCSHCGCLVNADERDVKWAEMKENHGG